MRFFLIPVADALPAVQERLHHPTAGSEDSPNLVALAFRYIEVSELLLRYAQVLGGKPGGN
jgi:hypothetical protein